MASRIRDGQSADAVRLFAGFAGFGAASVNLAIASSLLVEPARAAVQWQIPVAAAAGLWGIALIVWTVTALRGGTFPLPRLAMALLLAAAGTHIVAIATARSPGPSSLSISQLAALLLTLMIVASAAWLQRQDRSRNHDGGLPTPAGPKPGRLLIAAFTGAVVVASVATPGLSASTAGQYAVPHGGHGVELPKGSHHQH
ncbi:hypothetical protein V3C33_00255 [Micrococcaceae bacterium Sec5.7]